MMDQSFVIKTLNTKEMMGVHELTSSKGSTLDCEILQKVDDEEEEGEVSPISPYYDTSTQQSEMDLCSGSSHDMFPYVVHMGMNHEKSLSCGMPPGRPPDLDLMEDVSCIDAPFIDPIRKGALEYHALVLRVWGKYKERKIFFPLTSLSILSSHTLPRKDATRMKDDTIMKQGRQSLNQKTNLFGGSSSIHDERWWSHMHTLEKPRRF